MPKLLAIEPPPGDQSSDITTKIPTTGYQPKATEPDMVPSTEDFPTDRYGLVHDGYKKLGPVDIFCFWENVFTKCFLHVR